MKRFFREAAVGETEDGFAVLLDGRPVKTPKKKVLALPVRVWAEAVALEWRDRAEEFDPSDMVLTKCANTAIDRVAGAEAAVAETLTANFCDLLCYRAAAPETLRARQQAEWDPLLDWAENKLGTRLRTGVGVAYVKQPEAAIASLRAILSAYDALTLTAFASATTLLGSLVLALALKEGRLRAEEAFALSRIDETFQNERWGIDAEAQARADNVSAELFALARILSA